MKRLPPEESLLRQVLDLARLRGWLRAHFRPARTARGWRTPVQGDGKGFPDLVLVRAKDRRILFVELKADSGSLSADQQAWLDEIREAGGEAAVWRPRDWKLIEETLA